MFTWQCLLKGLVLKCCAKVFYTITWCMPFHAAWMYAEFLRVMYQLALFFHCDLLRAFFFSGQQSLSGQHELWATFLLQYFCGNCCSFCEDNVCLFVCLFVCFFTYLWELYVSSYFSALPQDRQNTTRFTKRRIVFFIS